MEDAGSLDVDVEIESAWAGFARRLEAAYERMRPGTILTLHVRPAKVPDEGRAPFVRFVRTGERVLVVVPSNDLLAPRFRLDLRDEVFLRGCRFHRSRTGEPERWRRDYWWRCLAPEEGAGEEIASVVAEVLRHVFGVIDPALLRARVIPRREHGLPTLVPDAPVEERRRFPKPALTSVEDPDHLHRLIGQALSHHMDEEIGPDDVGDFQLVLGGCPFWVRPARAAPCIEVVGCVVVDLDERPAAGRGLREVNERAPLGFLHRRGRQLWMTVRFPAVPFFAEGLYAACAIVDCFLDRELPALLEATGGRRAQG